MLAGRAVSRFGIGGEVDDHRSPAAIDVEPLAGMAHGEHRAVVAQPPAEAVSSEPERDTVLKRRGGWKIEGACRHGVDPAFGQDAAAADHPIACNQHPEASDV